LAPPSRRGAEINNCANIWGAQKAAVAVVDLEQFERRA
jgi:hypothetical protein